MAWASFVLRASVRDVRRGGLLALSGLLLTTLAALAIGATQATLDALARLEARWRADLRVLAVLRGEPSGADPTSTVDSLIATVRTVPGVGAVRYVSAAEALADLRRYLGPAGEGLDRLPTNPVPARVEVRPAPALRAGELEALVAALGRIPGVDRVQAATHWVEPFERLGRAIRLVGPALGAMLGLAALLAIRGAAALARARRADETELLRLAGVSEGRLWAPLVISAAGLGALGAGLGLAALVGGAGVVVATLRDGLGGLAALGPVPGPGLARSLALVGGGLGLGALGTFIAGRP